MSEINEPDPPIKTFVKGPLDLWMGAIVVVTRRMLPGCWPKLARFLSGRMKHNEARNHGTEYGSEAKDRP